LLGIPRGSTHSYAALARSLGAPQAIRAAAAAVGRNPLSVVIPCHRVVGSDGSLTGYAGGLGRKRALLALEQGRGLPWRTIGSAYAPQYPDPIAVDVGERVRFQARPDDGEFPGWRWAEGADGRCGWVPEAWFRVDGDQGVARRRYSARELPVAAGDGVLVLDEFGGWLWVSNEAGDPGWIPASVVAG
jgi:O-6-methylguanine DNA methyltransferase